MLTEHTGCKPVPQRGLEHRSQTGATARSAIAPSPSQGEGRGGGCHGRI